MIDFLLWGFGILILVGVFFLWIFRKKYLTVSQVKSAAQKIDATRSLDPAHAILEIHKIFVRTLENIGGKNRPAARVIARHKKRLPHIRKIWEIHRLRNQIAHEIGIKVTPKEAEQARRYFIQALEALQK